MTTYEQIHTLWITMWTLVAFSVLVVLAFGLVFWELAKLRRQTTHLQRITRPASVQVHSTGGGGGGYPGHRPVHIAMKGGGAGTADGPGEPGSIQVFEQDPGGRVRQMWPPEPPANT